MRLLPTSRRYAPARTAVHCGHHKCLTVYFHNVLRRAARRARVGFFATPQLRLEPDRVGDRDFVLVHDSQIDLDRFRGCRATHVIRDPRDLVVSGYFYHLRTTEAWCALPNPHHGDLPEDVSYQQHLRSLSIEDGLCYEIAHVSGGVIEQMLAWDYARDDVLELRFEDIVGNERRAFEHIFRWYGVSESGAAKLAGLAQRHSLAAIRKSGSAAAAHARSGSPVGQWRRYFTPRVEAFFEERYGRALIDLGYADGRENAFQAEVGPTYASLRNRRS